MSPRFSPTPTTSLIGPDVVSLAGSAAANLVSGAAADMTGMKKDGPYLAQTSADEIKAILTDHQLSTSGSGEARIIVSAPQGIPRRMVLEYLDNCRGGLRLLHEAIAQSDFEFARVYGHRMKGCGGAYGFHYLTQTGALIEQAGLSRDRNTLQTHAAALETYLLCVEVMEP